MKIEGKAKRNKKVKIVNLNEEYSSTKRNFGYCLALCPQYNGCQIQLC